MCLCLHFWLNDCISGFPGLSPYNLMAFCYSTSCSMSLTNSACFDCPSTSFLDSCRFSSLVLYSCGLALKTSQTNLLNTKQRAFPQPALDSLVIDLQQCQMVWEEAPLVSSCMFHLINKLCVCWPILQKKHQFLEQIPTFQTVIYNIRHS